VQIIDVGAFAGPEAEVMQADAALLEGGTGVLGRWSADRYTSAAADAVIDPLVVHHPLQPKERQQLAVEFAGALVIRGGEKDMRDAVDFHRLPLGRDFG